MDDSAHRRLAASWFEHDDACPVVHGWLGVFGVLNTLEDQHAQRF
jgi:hypothetical protein